MANGLSPARLATLVAVPVAVIVGIVFFWLLGGFRGGTPTRPRPQSTAPVPMSAPSLAPAQAAACRDLSARLPAALRDRPRRPVTAGVEQNAAYGDPPITMACGVPPVSVPQTADVYVLSGVCWYPQPAHGGTVWTTADRETPVRVTVPASYSAPGQWVIEFSGPVAAALHPSAAAPAGCQAPTPSSR